jgi:hypothetical protein
MSIHQADRPLTEALMKEFEAFNTNWKEIAIPRCGGVVLESFNCDEVWANSSDRDGMIQGAFGMT